MKRMHGVCQNLFLVTAVSIGLYPRDSEAYCCGIDLDLEGKKHEEDWMFYHDFLFVMTVKEKLSRCKKRIISSDGSYLWADYTNGTKIKRVIFMTN
jgi:hypothetical protein